MNADPVRDALLDLAHRAGDMDNLAVRVEASGIIGDRLPMFLTAAQQAAMVDAVDELVGTVQDLRDLADGMLDPLTFVDGWEGPGAGDYARCVLESRRDQALNLLCGGA